MKQEMFKKWMKLYSGLKNNTQKNYLTAINKLESKYNVSIYDSNKILLEDIIRKLESFDEYKEYNLSQHNVYSATLKQYSNFLDYLNNVGEVFKNYYEENKNSYVYNEFTELKKEFLEEYPLDRLKTLTLEEYSLGTDNFKESLSYKLEVGKYRYLCASIKGGTSEKFGIYKSELNGKKVWKIKGGVASEPELYWNELRNQLYNLLLDVKNNNIYDYSAKYKKLIGMPAVILKLAWIYNEDKDFIGVIGKDYLKSLGNIFCIPFDRINPESSLMVNNRISNYIRTTFSWVNELDEDIISTLMWNFNSKYTSDNNMSQNDIVEDEKYEDIFISNEKIESIKKLLFKKKNIILQGSPGVGKTFIAVNLLKEFEDFERIEIVQFHQSYSYEDFVQGFKPNEDGKFILKNGIFYNLVETAKKNLDKKYCIIIDEINRGNLSKIFGELLLLIENDKRDSKYALNLTYAKKDDVKFYIPENLYIVGTMNTADRSLSIVDYALRRRFSFIDIDPAFSNYKFKNYMIEEKVIDESFLDLVCAKMKKLNILISEDLGSGFEIGHSYFVEQLIAEEEKSSYQEIIEYEIIPLLKEYWYDDIDKINDAKRILMDI